jgi:hypothetical protein
MGFLSYGSAKALSTTHDYQKDIDRLYQREAYAQQVRAEKEKKSMFYASLMKEQTAAAPVNTQKLETLYEGLHKDVANYAVDNPDWETNPMKVQKMYGIMNQFIDNPVIREDQQVQQQWNATKEAFNKGDLKQDEYDNLAEKYHNYVQTGSSIGDSSKPDPYIFANPKRKDIIEILKERNDWLQPTISKVTDPVTGQMTKITKTPDENIHVAAVMGLTDPDTDFVISKMYSKIPPEDQGLYKSKTDYFEHLIKAGEIFGKEDAGYDQMKLMMAKNTLDKNTDLSNYHRFYQNNVYEPLRSRGETSSDTANISFTEFGTKGQPLAMGGAGRNLKVYGKGNQVNEINVQGHVVSVGAGRIINKSGVPWVETQVMISLGDDKPMTDASGNPVMRDMNEEEKARAKQKGVDSSKFQQVSQGLMANSLKENGFEIQKVTDPGMLANLGLEGATITSDVYVGTVLMPADFSEGNRIKYDLNYGTKENMSKGVETYNETLNVMEVLQSGNAPVASSMINSKVSKNLSVELGQSVGNLGWTQDESDPYVWYSKTGNKDIKYDFRTNKTFIAE